MLFGLVSMPVRVIGELAISDRDPDDREYGYPNGCRECGADPAKVAAHTKTIGPSVADVSWFIESMISVLTLSSPMQDMSLYLIVIEMFRVHLGDLVASRTKRRDGQRSRVLP